MIEQTFTDEEVQKFLADKPPEHFLRGPLRIQQTNDGYFVEGKAYFPSFLLKKRDHVNMTHYHHVLWNAVRFLEPMENLIGSRVGRNSGRYGLDGFRDTNYFVRIEIKRLTHSIGENPLYSLSGKISKNESFEQPLLANMQVIAIGLKKPQPL